MGRFQRGSTTRPQGSGHNMFQIRLREDEFIFWVCYIKYYSISMIILYAAKVLLSRGLPSPEKGTNCGPTS